MARPLRIEYPGAFYHVLNRGHRQGAIVDGVRDRRQFLLYLERMARQYSVVVHGYCVMTNHYHLILETPEANLSRAVQWLNVSYATYYNRRHQCTGHLFQGRFKAIVVEAASYLETLSRYIHLNPVRAGMASRPWDYHWSSCRYFVKALAAPDWLEIHRVLAGFGRSLKTARRGYADYLRQADGNDPFDNVLGSSVLGSPAFIEWIKAALLSKREDSQDIPSLRQLRRRPSAEQIAREVGRYYRVAIDAILRTGGKRNQPRDVAIYLARELSGLSCQHLGQYFGGISGAAVTMRYKHVEKRLAKDPKQARDIARMRQALTNNE